jgi:hypothetical protein
MLLQHPVFKGLIMLQPFLQYGCDQQVDLLRHNPRATIYGSVGWRRDLNGGGIFIPNDYDYYDTHVSSLGVNWYNNTAMVWCSSTEATPSGREIALSLVENSTHYFKLGCNAGVPTYYCRSQDGYNYTSDPEPFPELYDGHTFCLAGTASLDRIRVYVDGVEVAWAPGEVDSQGDGGGDPILIGDEPSGYGFDQGTIYLAAVWNRPLSPAELKMLYKWGPGLVIPTEHLELPFYGAISAGVSSFEAAWAINSSQVL